MSIEFGKCILEKYTRHIGVRGQFIYNRGKCHVREELSIKNLAPWTTLKQNIFVCQKYYHGGEGFEDTFRFFITKFLGTIKIKFFAKCETLHGKLWEGINSQGVEMVF